MRVDQLHRQVLFDGISSKLSMYKTSAIGMLLRGALCQFQQFKRMTIISNAIKHYQFRSCLRTYSLVCGPIRYPKTVKNASPDVSASCTRMRGGKRITTNSIAACARKQGIRGLFDGVTQVFKQLKALKTNPNRRQSTKAGRLTDSGATHHA
jgi:hypothetical protein